MSSQPSDQHQFKLLIKRARKKTVKNQNQAEQYDIYQKGSQQSISGSMNSSFQLQEKQQSQNQQQNIQKVLHRLGLNKKQGSRKDEELEIVVGNIVENCLGTVNTEINASEYDKIYGNQYKQLAAAKTSHVSILVNQLNDLQKIELLSSSGIFGVYKYIRYFAKKISILCQAIVEHNLFQSCILVIIILNSVKMALDDPLSEQDPYATFQNIFTGLYTTEMVLKIFAFGLVFPSKAYLRDPWNVLDFVIVITSLMPLVIDLNFSVNSLRAIRVLRPLKTITKVKALKMIVSTLFHSFSLVMDSLYILTFVMFVFAIAGTQLFSGILKQRCIELETGSFNQDSLCSIGGCSQGYICGKTVSSPNFSINNFDTILWSLLSVFRSLTLEGWSDIMIALQKCFNQFAVIYSMLVVFFCQYVLLNMTLAILKYKYSQVKGNTIQEEQEQKTDYQPEFLKKLGIFAQITCIPAQPNLVRQPLQDKIFVGSQIYFEIKQNAIQNPFNYQFSKLRKMTQKLGLDSQHFNKIKKEKIDIQQLKNIGKIDEQRWDPKCLFFQSDLPINGADQDNKVKIRSNSISIKSNKSIKDNNQQIPENYSEEEDSSEYSDQYSDQSQGLQSEKQQQVNGRIFQITQKLNKSKKNIQNNFLDIPKEVKISISEDVKENERKSSNKLKSKKRVSSRRNVSKQNRMKQELDSILGIVSRDAMQKQAKQTTFELNLPQIDFDNFQTEKLYERFNDLGQYKIKRQQKINQLHFFKINHKKQSPQKKNIPNIMKQIQQQNSLDIKQLQMVNQLSKKMMKCRIKPKIQLDQQSKYDESRVLVSQKLKETEKKEKQLFDNLQNMNFDVKYKLQPIVVDQELEKQKKGLKIPQPLGYHESNHNVLENQKKSVQEQNSYLKLLQNHQMEEKIQMEEARLMQTFFKKEKSKPQKAEGQQSLELQYRAIRQADIYTRHGSIVLPCPFEEEADEELINSINIHPQQYEIYVKGFFGIINVLRKKTLLFVKTPFYDNFMLLFVIGNTLILSLNGLFNTDSQAFMIINYIFTAVFTIDITLKLFGYGMQFFGDVMNIFDMFVVSISLVEVSIGSGGSNLSALRSIRILRAFRVLRITRLVRSLNYMKIVLSVVSSVITQFVYIFMLLALFIFIYTLLGMQLFGGTFLPESITGIRQNFDNFFNAAFSVFQVLTVQNWNDIETLVLTSSKGQYYVIYLLSWIFVGNWILLNLLQAILLDGFDKDSIVVDEEDEQLNSQKKIKKQQQPKQPNLINKQKNQDPNQSFELNFDQEDASLLMFYSSNWVRIIAIKITSSMIFENIIIFAIALSSIKLVADTYVSEGSKLLQIFDIIDIVFNGIFIAQAALKIIAQGFILGPNAYLKSSWSKLDFFIVITAIIDMSIGIDLSILKLFRTLRPLRIISRNPDMKIIISSLGQSIMGIMNVLFIIMSVFLMFSILGINLYQSKLNFCNPTKELVFNNFGPYNVDQKQCQSQGGVWTLQFINFDNIINSMLSMYVFSTRENWPYYVYSFFDGTTQGPVLDSNSQILNMVFSVIIIFICSYFFMDLLVGVLFMNFHEAEAKIRPKTLTDKQINWKNLQKVIVNSDPCFELYLKPESRFRSFFYNIVTFKWFQIFIAVCILGNILTMIMSEDDQSTLKTTILANINLGFSIIFILQMILKMFAFCKGYFLSGWNIFDFFVVMASILDIVLGLAGVNVTQNASISVLPQIARIFRVLRVTRLLRMFKRFKGLQKLIQTFIFSLPALGKGLSIVSLFLFIAAVLASYLLGNISYDYAGNIGQDRNFYNFDNSLQLLFITTTGQNWYFYMYQSIQQGYVVCKEGTSCTNIFFIVFWLIYIFMSQKVFMELFVLIVLDQFEANYINQHNPLGIFSLYEEDFRSNWIEFTLKHHAEKIEVKKVVELLMVLKQPLGLGKNELMSNYEAQLRDNEKNLDEDVKNSLNQLDMKIKKNAAKLVNKINAIKNRMYMGYHQTFYNFAKISAMSQINQNITSNQKKQLQQLHKQSQQQLQKMKPQGNLYYFDESSDQMAVQTLNPIELILFCQMIIKSWHNYSLKYHSQSKSKKRQNKNKKPQNNQSLNNSCASDIVEADLQKIKNDKRFEQRKGLIQSGLDDPTMLQFVNMPNTYEHYKYDKKRVAQFRRMTRRTKKSNIFTSDV